MGVAVNFVRRLVVMVESWSDSKPTPYAAFVDQQSERMVEEVFATAAKAVEKARAEKRGERPIESHFIAALIDKLQDAGF